MKTISLTKKHQWPSSQVFSLTLASENDWFY